MTTSASSTLTAAMMPSMTLVVPRSSMSSTSEGIRLVMRRERVRLAAIAERLVQNVPALRGHTHRPIDCSAQLDQFACEIFNRRLELSPQLPTPVGKEHVSGNAARDRPYRSSRDRP